MKSLLKKFKSKEKVQDFIIEVIGDIVMIVLGLILAYYLKTFMM